MYVSWDEIVLRPMICPTVDHRAFADAHQRVYMSATLRSSGDIERAFGVTGLARINVPAAGDEQGFGRRFFVMPGASLSGHETDALIRGSVTETGRALMLTPSRRELERLEGSCVPEGTPVIEAGEVEDHFDAFTDKERAVLLLANRYDGIDLPGEACRLVVISGLPVGTEPQERFLADTLGARRVLDERIRTRIVQGAGRCTRSARDFAAVIVRGERLLDFLSRDEVRRALPPQLQAEIDFGFENAENSDGDLSALLGQFWEQDADWQSAEEFLRSETASLDREAPAVEGPLAAAADLEVECWRAVTHGDLHRAIDLAQLVTDRLIGSEELRPYRALWFYLAASWSAHLATDDPGVWAARAKELRAEAEGAAARLRWRPRFVRAGEVPPAAENEPLVERGARAAANLRRLGIRGNRFERALADCEAKLGSDEASNFEEGLRVLGGLLGFEAVRPPGQAQPDSAWRDGERLWLVFEAKTEEDADQLVSVATVRQALTHRERIASDLDWPEPERSVTTVVTPRTTVDPAAASIAGELRMCSPEEVRAVGARALEALREVRLAARGLHDDGAAAAMAAAFRARTLDNEGLTTAFGGRRIAVG